MKYLNFFDDCYYINLDHRNDRNEKFKQRSAVVGIEANRVSGIQYPWQSCPFLSPYILEQQRDDEERQRKANEIGCALSHRFIIQAAKDRNLSNVLIFEDDVVFLDSFGSQVQRVIADIEAYDIPWDIIYFGGEPNAPATPITENIATITAGGVYGCHAYAVHSRFFDAILDWDMTSAWGIIDIFLLHYPESKRQYLLSRQQVALQDTDSMSDLRGHKLTAVQEQHQHAWNRFVESQYE